MRPPIAPTIPSPPGDRGPARLCDAMQSYAQRFGELPSLFVLPVDMADAIAEIEEALASGKPIDDGIGAGPFSDRHPPARVY